MASSISNQLRSDETILYQAGLNKTPLFACVICVLIFTPLLVMINLYPSSFLEALFQKNPHEPMGRVDLLLCFGVTLFFIFVLWLSVKFIYDFFRSEVAVTNQRIIGKIPTGFCPFVLQSLDLPISEVIYVYTTYYGGSSYGYVIAVDRLGRRTIFRNFADPEELRRRIIEAGVVEQEPPEEVRRRRVVAIVCFFAFIITAFICGYLLPLLEYTSKGKAPPPRADSITDKNVHPGLQEKGP